METTKKTTAKKKLIDDNQIISKYMDYVLEKNEEPKNVFSFCKEHKIEEKDFYTFFGSIDALKQEIWAFAPTHKQRKARKAVVFRNIGLNSIHKK